MSELGDAIDYVLPQDSAALRQHLEKRKHDKSAVESYLDLGVYPLDRVGLRRLRLWARRAPSNPPHLRFGSVDWSCCIVLVA